MVLNFLIGFLGFNLLDTVVYLGFGFGDLFLYGCQLGVFVLLKCHL